MARVTHKQYRIQVLILMAIYIALMLLVWPYARHATPTAWKLVLTLTLTAPVNAVIWLMARRVMHGDELEQRVELVALSAATGIVAALSLIGGFFCAAGLVDLDGDVLIWVFPALCLAYSAARWIYARRYGGMGCG
jgi:hypothetical protein